MNCSLKWSRSVANKMTYLYLKKDINHIERIQRAEPRWVKGLIVLNYEERLKALQLQPLEKKDD